MGRSSTPAYRVEFKCEGRGLGPICWRSRAQGQLPGYGSPNVANLAAFVAGYNRSFEPGGVNAHCGPLRIVAAKIVHNDGAAAVVATWTAAPAA